MAQLVWNFLLPEQEQYPQVVKARLNPSGKIVAIFVNNIAHQGNYAALDEHAPIRFMHHSARIELRPVKKSSGFAGFFKKSDVSWQMFVNGHMVEPYEADAWSTKRSSGNIASHGQGLRNKSLPDGSYIIQTSYSSDLIADAHWVRKWRFDGYNGATHEVWLHHRDFVWCVCVDGQIVVRETHEMADNECAVSFDVACGQTIPCHLSMAWHTGQGCWRYALVCNGSVVVDPFESIAGHVSTSRASVVDPNVNTPGIYNEYGKFIPAVDQNASPSSQKPIIGSPDPYSSLSPLATPYHNTNMNSSELPPGVTHDEAMSSIRGNPMYKAVLRQNGKFIQKSGFESVEEAAIAYENMKGGASMPSPDMNSGLGIPGAAGSTTRNVHFQS